MNEYYNGRTFFNPWLDPLRPKKGLLDFIKLRISHEWAKWPSHIPTQPTAPLARVHDQIKVTFINHSTFLIQTHGLNILTDPVWSERVSPFKWAGPKRVHSPGVKIEDLPPLDLILISHNHYDHLDFETLRTLASSHTPLILTGIGNKELLQKSGHVETKELEWWQFCDFQKFRIHFVPAQHFSGRSLHDQNRTLWGGFIVETPIGNKIYFAGDSGYGAFVQEISTRFGPIDLAFIPIGAYEPRPFFKDMHNNPDDAVKTHLDLQARQSIACHFGTFQLTAEAIHRPAEDLNVALDFHGVSKDAFLVPRVGGEYHF